jgi:mannitol-1-/sugar-/sorbitol-6-phosphatase
MLTPGHTFADRTFDAILFDMDGTLISSIAAVDRSWARWASEYGYDSATFRIPHGTPARTIVERLVPAERVDEASARIDALELADTDGVHLLVGAGELLSSLPTGRFSIVTSCTRDLAWARIRAAGIVAPTVVVTADDVAQGKPDPEPFARGAELLGMDAARCLVVEDAPAGLAAGRAAGSATLGVSGTHELAELDADAHAHSVANIRIITNRDGSLSVLDR